MFAYSIYREFSFPSPFASHLSYQLSCKSCGRICFRSAVKVLPSYIPIYDSSSSQKRRRIRVRGKWLWFLSASGNLPIDWFDSWLMYPPLPEGKIIKGNTRARKRPLSMRPISVDEWAPQEWGKTEKVHLHWLIADNWFLLLRFRGFVFVRRVLLFFIHSIPSPLSNELNRYSSTSQTVTVHSDDLGRKLISIPSWKTV